MFKAMAWKEFREMRVVVIVAAGIYTLLGLGMAYPNSFLSFLGFSGSRFQQGEVPFINDAFIGKYCWLSAALAIALGLIQTMGESARGTYLFLLHRPTGRGWIICLKLLTGITVYLVVGAIPILAYGLWAATPGTHASPFQWSMTCSTWIFWLAVTVLYFGAFLSGIRPGRWHRSRFLPLAAAALVLAITTGIAEGSPWLLLPCAIVILADVWLAALVFYAARTRDYP